MTILYSFVSPIFGQEYSFPSIPASRLEYLQEVMNEAVEKHDSLQLAEAFYLYGKSYAGIGNYKTAQEYFLKSLQLQEHLRNHYLQGRLYIRMGEINVSQGFEKEALGYAKKAKDQFMAIESQKGYLSYVQLMALIYEINLNDQSIIRSTRFDSLISIYKKIYFLAQSTQDSIGMASANLKLGQLLVDKNPAGAIEYINTAIGEYERWNITGLAVSWNSIVPAYINIGQLPKAYNALEKTRAICQKHGISDLNLNISILKNSVKYFRAIGDFKKSFEYLQELNTYEKQQIRADRNGALARLSLEYENEKNEKLVLAQSQEINQRKEEQKWQQLMIWGMGTLLLLAIMISWVYYRLYSSNRQTSRWNAILLQEQNHRVKNNLQIISSLLNLQSKRLSDPAARNAVNETRLRVESMAILHRRLYDDDNRANVNLAEFISEVVLEVCKAYNYAHIHIVLEIDDARLGADKAIRLGLILNELTTNACKYAFPYQVSPTFHISCNRVHNKVKLQVKDNGPGWDATGQRQGEDSYTRKTTLGVSLIKTLAEQLKGKGKYLQPGQGGMGGTEYVLEFKI